MVRSLRLPGRGPVLMNIAVSKEGVSLRAGASNSPGPSSFCPYSPKCVEQKFSEVRGSKFECEVAVRAIVTTVVTIYERLESPAPLARTVLDSERPVEHL